MTTVAGPAESQRRDQGASLFGIAAVIGLVAVPLLLYIVMLQTFWDRGELSIDLTQTLLPAAQEIAHCFVDEGGRRTDTVVLACTHFPLLLSRLERLAPWPVSFIDPAPAIARRVVELIGPPTASAATSAEITFTSSKPPSEPLRATLARFGLTSISR